MAWGMWVHGYVPLSHSGTHPYEKLSTNKQQEARFVRYHGPGMRPGSKVIKHFSCSTQLSMKIFLLINVKMLIIVGILTFMSGKNSILGLSESKKA